eukprot:gnl/TRDRNA2_/TRDRNA2_93626_c0_seq1.p1 gnl/TRDRNA2_/TRDRNA2_93626_c0~~gnl/TRDRNA2_/TRDRNA2_93626_c0_seq1.p1  ORF type:complete len:493 (+),score=89.05 gnl/TRDRNA2_/TRDRNA2_93626_c0_seq1:59-1537(+)
MSIANRTNYVQLEERNLDTKPWHHRYSMALLWGVSTLGAVTVVFAVMPGGIWNQSVSHRSQAHLTGKDFMSSMEDNTADNLFGRVMQASPIRGASASLRVPPASATGLHSGFMSVSPVLKEHIEQRKPITMDGGSASPRAGYRSQFRTQAEASKAPSPLEGLQKFWQNLVNPKKKAASGATSAKNLVAVFGATGRVGQLVVKRLLAQGYNVRAMIRNETKASAVLPAGVEKVSLDIRSASSDEVMQALKGAKSTIWCASGFTDDMQTIDSIAMKEIPSAFAAAAGQSEAPRIVMLSSAAVTRPSWDDDKKKKLAGAADIPIVNLNPGDVLNKKVAAEDVLRQSGVPYSIVRPTGLKFQDWPSGRPMFSQGDVAVGRTNGEDLAEVLVSVLEEPSATGKTFEMITLAGYPAPNTLASILEPLKKDSEGPLDPLEVEATHRIMQQLLPGEEQDATKLEMGRTYEQVDRGEVARTPGAAPTEREKKLAAGVAASR